VNLRGWENSDACYVSGKNCRNASLILFYASKNNGANVNFFTLAPLVMALFRNSPLYNITLFL
jgi:hypothetical protein